MAGINFINNSTEGIRYKQKSYRINYLRWKGLSRGHKRYKYLQLCVMQSPFSNSEIPPAAFAEKTDDL